MYAPLQSFYKMVGPHWPWSKKKPPLASAAACAPAIEAPGAGRASSRSAACVENAKGTGMQDGKGTTEIRKIGPHMFTRNRSNVFKCDQIILHPDHPRRVNHNIYKMVGLAVARSLQSQSECLQNGWSWYVLIIQSQKKKPNWPQHLQASQLHHEKPLEQDVLHLAQQPRLGMRFEKKEWGSLKQKVALTCVDIGLNRLKMVEICWNRFNMV